LAEEADALAAAAAEAAGDVVHFGSMVEVKRNIDTKARCVSDFE